MNRFKKFFVFALLFSALFIFGFQVAHHHEDSLIHDDCTVCHGVQIFSSLFENAVFSSLFSGLVFLWLFQFIGFRADYLVPLFSTARAPPLFS